MSNGAIGRFAFSVACVTVMLVLAELPMFSTEWIIFILAMVGYGGAMKASGQEGD